MLVCCVCSMLAFGQKSASLIPLKILYVGNDPSRPNPIPDAKSGWPKRNHDLGPTRMPDFKQFLDQHFKAVTLVDARDYKPALSNDYDVTIFDAQPEPLVPEKKIKDADGRIIKTIYAKYLPENFSKPVILLSGNGGMVFSIGVKFAPECVCLGADAYNINTAHEIFKNPVPVSITMPKKETPVIAKLFSKELSEQVPMWRVQKESVYEGTGYPPGVVYFHLGLNEPDAEFISGGVSAKDQHAAAIARHGNFLLWGFNAAPSDMTEEAKKVFINSICYIKKFDGQQPVVRLSADPFPVERASIAMGTDLASLDGFNRYKTMWEKSSKPGTAAPKIEWNSFLQQRYEFVKSIAGADSLAVQMDTLSLVNYCRDNLKYFNGTMERSGSIDLDVKSLGIANNDLRLLETCVEMLAQNKDKEKAMRLLKRYTNQNYNTASEWRNWLSKNRRNLFFTEAGGYKFIVAPSDWTPSNKKADDLGKTDTRVQKALSEINCLTPDKLNPVMLGAALIDGNGADKKLLVLKVKLLKNWHIYSYVPTESPFIQSQLSLELPLGVKQVGNWQSSAAKPMPGDPGVMIYEDEVCFIQELSVPGNSIKGSKATVSLYYQACDASQCLPPDTATKEIIF
ncbi:Disulphide bond corrector protein DsbC [Pedobacter nyackensis]|uniref:Disulphide bond corrector protein DsbC n=2 Tax=Pedobacter nyackensis TaxID=475255 RepID=A0A1W2EZL2_9SPHI|nr:Disulphide bond corrector protein DsbC [Pedobacter nyackensis]